MPDDKKKILVLEDEDELRKIMIDILTKAGYECTGCGDFGEAFRLVTETQFDLLTLDLLIDDGYGVDVAKWIRKTPNHINYDTPVIVISGSLDYDSVEFLRDKVVKMLPKPLSSRQLLANVSEILSAS